MKPSIDSLLHYGVKRKSGRYPWGSGDDPDQSGDSFLNQYRSLKDKGLDEKEVASRLGMNTRQLREARSWAVAEQKERDIVRVKQMSEEGLSNVEIGNRLGVSEGTVRNYLSEKTQSEKTRTQQLDTIGDAIKSGVDQTGYLDVGVGVERQLGISRTKFNTVVNKMVESGEYHVHEVHVQRLSDPTGTKYTTVKVLTKDPDVTSTRKNSDKIRPLDSWSDDGSATINKLKRPDMIDLKRVQIRYKEDGGADKDGLIELRPGVSDLDLGTSKYAQVRIGAGDDLYMKGMAAYSYDKFPDGVDIIYNTNKSKGTPPDKVLKKMSVSPKDSDDPNFIFGSSIARQKGALNVVNEQGEWDTWSGKFSSQFLSKQPLALIKDRLDDTHASLRKELNEIASMNNAVVKSHLLDSESSGFIGSLDKKASHLKAKGLKDTKSHVLMPFPDMNPNEIYATNYKNGDRVVLVRHPHGGIFEIPDLVVNNKHPRARKMLGDAIDAVGIHPSVAEKLSGADFDGDTALVIPNNRGQVKTSRALKELKNFDPKMYQRDHETISKRTKEIQMGVVSNLITDMTIKGASDSEIARAVKHSMVVIDAEKHKLDYKQSSRDNGIPALIKKYQTHVNPETGKVSRGASTLISRSKQKIDISQHDTVRDLAKDKVSSSDGRVLKKGLTPSEIAKKLKISEATVKGYLSGKEFDPGKYSSGYAQDVLYTQHIRNIQVLKNDAIKISKSIKMPSYSKDAAKIYKDEVNSLNAKLNVALLNSPRERQAQILTNKLFYEKFNKDMDKDDVKSLKKRALAAARVATGAKRTAIQITDTEWEAIQARAVSNDKLKNILKYADMDIVRKHATPRERKLDSGKVSRAKTLLNNGYTYAEVAEVMGVSPSTLREELK